MINITKYSDFIFLIKTKILSNKKSANRKIYVKEEISIKNVLPGVCDKKIIRGIEKKKKVTKLYRF